MSPEFPVSAVVVIPTYNERQTLRTIVERVLTVDGVRVLVVDDNSPDGTGHLADALAHEQSRVSVLHRPRPDGLGSAYIAGFRAALDAGATVVCQMDADGSHDTADLTPLIAALATADLVLGSRYIPGSNIHDWPLSRQWLSHAGNGYAQLVSRVPVRDITTGYRAWRAAALRAMPLDKVQSRGHGFQVEMTILASREALRIAEVPISFQDRLSGVSKLTTRTLIEFVRSPWRAVSVRRAT